MGKIPDQPRDIFEAITQDYRAAYGKDLVSLMLYGSAVGGSYIKGKSDINILVVLTPAGINRLENAFVPVKKWRKANVAVPLFMTKDFISSSLDCYPIEFLNMQNNCELIYGENVLAPLVFQPEDLRLQIERELKGKILWLREGYVESEGSPRRLRDLITRSFTAFASIFNAMIYLKTKTALSNKRDTVVQAEKIFGLNAGVLELCLSVKEKKDTLSGAEMGRTFALYLWEAEKACSVVEHL